MLICWLCDFVSWSVGISSETILKPSSISEEELIELISKLNSDHRVDGLLVQLPLPGASIKHIVERITYGLKA